MVDQRTPSWDVAPGMVLRRKLLHDRFGGSRQGGIGPSRSTPNILVFTDPKVGALHGYYDRWDGNVFHYTGEGQRGDQQMVQGNKALLDHVESGRSLRVFEGSSGDVMYVGEFMLDSTEPWYEARAPETGGGPMRNVIMFRLLPVGPIEHEGSVALAGDLRPTLDTEYRRVDEETGVSSIAPAVVDPDIVDRGVKGHKVTQNALAEFLQRKGLKPLSPGPGDPGFDVGWWDDGVLYIAEVKSLTIANETGQMRSAIGQLLDYAFQVRAHRKEVRPVIVLERAPVSDRWVALCGELKIALSWPGNFDSI